MKIFFGQIYIEPGVSFPFTIQFQQYLSHAVSELVVPSHTFSAKYASDWNVIFRISAKREIEATMINGPTTYRKEKNMEYSIFLPFDSLQIQADPIRMSMRMLLDAVAAVLSEIGISTEALDEKKSSLIESMCSNPIMIKAENQ